MKKMPSHLKNKNASFRPNQAGLKKILGELEAEAMEITWELDRPVTIREVYEIMRDRGKKFSYLTLMTVMNRLEDKEILKVVGTIQRAHVFLPTYNREDFLQLATGVIIESLLQDFPDQMAVHFQKHPEVMQLEKLEVLTEKITAKRQKEKNKDKKE
jgi:predicted transcriptional regulator